jgi:hypothetical protein
LPDEGSTRFSGILAVWILRCAQDDGKERRTKFFLTRPKTRFSLETSKPTKFANSFIVGSRLLFQIDRSGVSRHINNILEDKELDYESNAQKMRIANSDKPTEYFSLNMILAVGYRVNSKIATKFRQWTTSIYRNISRRDLRLTTIC